MAARRVTVEIPVYYRGNETTVAITDLIYTMECNGFVVLHPMSSSTKFVLTQTWREGEYDYARDVTKVVAVSDSPGPLIRMVYELMVVPDPERCTIETKSGSFKIESVPVAERKGEIR